MVKSNLEGIVKCLHQVFKPLGYIKEQEVGNCRICSYDPPENKKCKSYYPITAYEIYVRPNENSNSGKS